MAMAPTVSSRSVVAFACDAYHRMNTGPSTSLRQPTSITSPRLVDYKQGLTWRFLKLLKILSITNHVESRVRKPSHIMCSSIESSTSDNGGHYYSTADVDGSSLQQDNSSERVGHRNNESSRAGAVWKDSSLRVFNRRAAMLASMAVFVVGSSCPCCREALAVEEDWSYGGPSEPSKWGGTCAVGARQSPINVDINKALHGEALGELQFDYKLCTPTFKNPGHGTMQVNFPEGVNKLRLKGRELNLVQFHFHIPSEHAFNGLRFPMEAHLVHQSRARQRAATATAVVPYISRFHAPQPVQWASGPKSRVLRSKGSGPPGASKLLVMLDASADAFSNGALAAALRYSPLEHGKALTVSNVQVSANDLLPPKATKNDRRYIHYFGSFTTPPCTESVDWFLLEKPLKVPTSEVLEFMKFVGDEQTLALNARPIQRVGDREIFEGP